MIPLKCPWCNENTNYPSRLGCRVEKDNRDFFSTKFRLWVKFELVCPYCGNPVRIPASSFLWMILSIPFVFYFVWLSYLFSVKGTIVFLSPFFYWTFGASTVLLFIGIIMFALTRKLEKVEPEESENNEG